MYAHSESNIFELMQILKAVNMRTCISREQTKCNNIKAIFSIYPYQLQMTARRREICHMIDKKRRKILGVTHTVFFFFFFFLK